MTTPSSTGLDLQSAADELGVHYQTAYRWVRSGRLPAVRVAGRYLIDRCVLDEFTASRSQPQPTSAPSVARVQRTADRLYDELVDGDEPAVRRAVRRLVDDGAPLPGVIEQVLAPALRRIGEEWHRGELSIWVEHRASAIVERVLGDVTPNPRGRRRGTAVVTAVSGELHSLPTTMAAVALRGDQWQVHHLGADLPTDDLIRCCADHDVDLVVITVTNPELRADSDVAAELVRSAGWPVLVGGPGRTLTELVDEARAVGARPTGSR
ncbi:MAG: B12-binding domain-containing protein [Ilumatobacteraceae bacterium]